jgi:acyl CoA:acetate/3-ketoacid CoA transferase alpha subunit
MTTNKRTPGQRKAGLLLAALLGPAGVALTTFAGVASLALVLTHCANPLQDELDRLRKEKEELQNQKDVLEAAATGDTAALEAAKADAAAKQEAIDLKTRQISALRVGGQYHDKAWFDQHDANVAAARSLGDELTTVFIGDGVIREMWDGASGIIDTATAKGKIPNLKTDRAFVIVAAGDNAGDLKWKVGIRDAGDTVAPTSEVPAKPAYIVSHFGRSVVEKSGLGTADDPVSLEVGTEIGIFHAFLRILFPDSYHITSGIIPANPIGTNNTANINAMIQTKIGATGAANQYINTIENHPINALVSATNNRLSGMDNTTMTAMSRQNSGIYLADNTQPGRVESDRRALADDHRAVNAAVRRMLAG